MKDERISLSFLLLQIKYPPFKKSLEAGIDEEAITELIIFLAM